MQRLQIQLFLARAAAAASLVSPEQERWNAVWQLLQVSGLMLQAMLRLQSAGWVVRLLLLYLAVDRPTNDCFREVVWLAVLSTHPPSLSPYV